MNIKEQFDKVISYSQDIPNPKTNELFDNWEKNKKFFIDIFGDLIYELPETVSFHLDPEEKHQRIKNFADTVESRYGYPQLAKFILTQEEGFFQNLTISNSTGWDGKIIKKGAKLVKSFKHFIHDSRSLADIQNEASRIIQEDKIEGKLCFSVHPLDFLSLSENRYNWTSCHALDGEYRAGNLSYMQDNCTFICYLKGDNNVELPNFGDVKWNSKKWRTLLHLSKDSKLIAAGRSYPFASKEGMDMVQHILKEKFSKSLWTPWVSTVLLSNIHIGDLDFPLANDYMLIGQALQKKSTVIEDAQNSCHYNDLLYSSVYKPVYMSVYQTHPFNEETGWMLTACHNTHLEVGHSCTCLRCGETIISNGAGTMMCTNCELHYGTEVNDTFTYCDCCGRRMLVDDSYVVDDEEICPICIEEHYAQCENCYEYVRNDDIKYNEDTQQYLCEYCMEEIKYG